MKKIIFAVFVLLPSLLFSQNFLSYFPVKSRAMWDYFLYSEDSNKHPEQIVMISQLTLTGIRDEFTVDFLTLYEDGSTIAYEEYPGPGYPVVETGFVNIIGRTTTYDNPLPVIDEPGRSWTIKLEDEIDNFTSEYGSIKFNKFSFPDCIVITCTTNLGDGSVIVDKQYYAKNIGRVYESILRNGKTVSWRLKSSTFLN